MAKQQRQVYQCVSCGNKNPVPATAYQSLSCAICGHKHAIVYASGKRHYLPFDVQEKGGPASSEKAAAPAAMQVNTNK